MNFKRVGLIVNPIAGMGGSVGLKGTDGDAYLKALERGAKPVAPQRALLFLNSVNSENFEIVSAAGVMGEDVVKVSKHSSKLTTVLGTRKKHTSREDTIAIAKTMRNYVDVLVFVGGDGTARDICEAVGVSLPVIGVPSGVKMYSSVFALSPITAARLLDLFLKGDVVLAEREVLDIDEEAFRRDELVVKLYGYLLVPLHGNLVQPSKTMYTDADEELAKNAIAEYIVENMEPDIPYILGPGSTVKAICRKLNIDCTLLGVDILVNRQLVVKDAWEKDLLDTINRYGRVKLVITPIGGQGFLFGRGNQQISPRVLSLVKKEDIMIVATERKIRSIGRLIVDTGDPSVDLKLSGYMRVLVDYNRFITVKVISGSLNENISY